MAAAPIGLLPGGRRQVGAGKENGVPEVEALRPEDGRMARHKDEHVAGLGDDIALIFDGRLQPHDFIGGGKRAAHLMVGLGHVFEDGGEAAAALGDVLLHDGGGPRHARQPFGRLDLVRGIGDADMAVRDDALIAPIGAPKLRDVLGDEIGLDAVACDIGQRLLEDLEFAVGRELVQHQKQPVPVRPNRAPLSDR